MATSKAFPWKRLAALALPIVWLLLRHFGIDVPESWDSILYVADLSSAAIGGGAAGATVASKTPAEPKPLINTVG